MKYFLIGFLTMILVAGCKEATAHEMTPTYPVVKPHFVYGVAKVSMQIFNKREDVRYFEIKVFDKDFKEMDFVMSKKILRIPYLGKKDFEVYIKEADKSRIVYICSKSKLLKEDTTSTAVSSRICSKIK